MGQTSVSTLPEPAGGEWWRSGAAAHRGPAGTWGREGEEGGKEERRKKKERGCVGGKDLWHFAQQRG